MQYSELMKKLSIILNTKKYSANYLKIFIEKKANTNGFSIQNILSLPLSRIVDYKNVVQKYLDFIINKNQPNVMQFKVKIIIAIRRLYPVYQSFVISVQSRKQQKSVEWS